MVGVVDVDVVAVVRSTKILKSFRESIETFLKLYISAKKLIQK